MRSLLCTLIFCSVAVVLSVAQAPPPPFPWGRCDPQRGSLRTVPVFTTTSPGSNFYVDLGFHYPNLGFASFQFNGTCVGRSHLQGLSPATAYIRSDGVAWQNPGSYDFELALYTNGFTEDIAPTPSPYSVSIFGYDGICHVELIVQYCECHNFTLGPWCRHNISHWNQEVVLPPRDWTYHCIPQHVENATVSEYAIDFFTTDVNAALIMYTRWGGVPSFFESEHMVPILPPQRAYNLTIHYPRYETLHNHTRCYWVALYNPSTLPIPYNLTYTSIECDLATDTRCVGNVVHARLNSTVTVPTQGNWTYVTFDPSQLPLGALLYEFILYSDDPNLALFVRRDGPPTLTQNDQSHGWWDNRTSHHRDIREFFPPYGLDYNTKWWVGVYSATGNKTTFTISSSANYCGRCHTDTGKCVISNNTFPACVCNRGYAGYDCSRAMSQLHIGGQSEVVSAQQLNYHMLLTPSFINPKVTLTIRVDLLTEHETAEFLILNDQVPTTYNNYYKSTSNSFIVTIVPPVLKPDVVWYFSVESMTGKNITYYIDVEMTAPPPATTSTSTSAHVATTSTSSHTITTSTSTTSRFITTTGGVAPVPGNDKGGLGAGAAAGLAIGMIVLGLIIGLAVAYVIAKRRGGLGGERTGLMSQNL